MVQVILEVNFHGRVVAQRGDRAFVEAHRYEGGGVTTCRLGNMHEDQVEMEPRWLKAHLNRMVGQLFNEGRILYFPNTPEGQLRRLRVVQDKEDIVDIIKMAKQGRVVPVYVEAPQPAYLGPGPRIPGLENA